MLALAPHVASYGTTCEFGVLFATRTVFRVHTLYKQKGIVDAEREGTIEGGSIRRPFFWWLGLALVLLIRTYY